MPVIGDASIIVRAITDGVKKDIEKAFKGLDKTMEKAGQSAGESFMDGLSREIESRGEEIGKKLNKSIMSGLGDKDKEIADLIGRAGDEAGERFSEGFAAGAFDGLDDLLNDLVDAFGDAGEEAGDAFGDTFSDSATDSFDAAADYAIGVFDGAGEDAGDSFGDSFVDSVSSRLGDLSDLISGDFSQLGRDAGATFSDNFASSARDGLSQTGTELGQTISDALGAAGGDAGQRFNDGFTENAFNGLDDGFDNLVDAFGDAGERAGTAFGDAFSESFDSVLDDLVDAFDDAGTDAGNLFGDAFADGIDGGELDNLIDDLIDLFGDAGSDAGDAFGDNFVDSVSSRLNNLSGLISGDFAQLGRDSGTAFGDNFASSARDGLTQAGSDFGRAISDAINANIDIQQPSAFRDIATTALGTRASGAADTTPADLLGGAGGAGVGQALADLLLLADTAADVADAFHGVNDAAGSPPNSDAWDELRASMLGLEQSNKALADSMKDALGSMTSVGDDADDTSGKLDNVADAMRRVSDESDFQMSLPFDGVADNIDDVTDALDRHGDSLRSTRDAAVQYQMQIPFDYSGMELDRINRELRQHVDNFEDISDSDPFPGIALNARSTGSTIDQLNNRLQFMLERLRRQANEKLNILGADVDADVDRTFDRIDTHLVNTHDYLVDLNLANRDANSGFRRTSNAVRDMSSAVSEAADEVERINAIFEHLYGSILPEVEDKVNDLGGGGNGRGGINNLFSNDFLSRARAASKAFTNLYATATFLGPAISGLISSLSALAAGFTALFSAIAPAVGVLGAIPGLIAPLVQGALVGVASFSGLGDAVKEAWDAMDAETPEEAAEALEKLNKTLETMDESAGPLVVTIAEMRDEFRAIRNAGQAGLFPEVNASLKRLTDTLTQPLIDLFRETGEALGVVTTGITDLVTSAGFLGKLDFLGTFNVSAIEAFGRILVNLVDIFSSILVASAPLVARFTAWVEQLSAGWRESLNLGDGMTKLIEFFERAGDVAAQLGGIFGDLWGALRNIGQAAGPAGQRLLDAFGGAIAKFERWTQRVKESGELEEYFDGAAKNTEALGRLFTEVAKEFGKLGDNANIGEAADALIPLVRNLGKMLDILTDSGPQLSEFAVKLSEVLLALTDSGAVDAFLATLSSVLDIILAIVNSEFGQWFLEVFGPILAVGRALAFALEVGQFFFLVVAGSATKLFDLGKALIGLPGTLHQMAAGMGMFVEAARAANGLSFAGQIAAFGFLAAAVAALTAVIIAGYIEIQNYNEVLNAATTANEKFANSFSVENMQEAVKTVDELNDKLDPDKQSLWSLGWAEVAASQRDGTLAAKASAASLDNLTGAGLIASKVFGVSLTEALGLGSSAMAEADAASADLDDTLNTWNRTVDEVARRTGLNRTEITKLGETLEVDLSRGAFTAAESIMAYYDSTVTGSPAALALADATNILNSSTSTAAEKTNAYLDALNALTSVQMGAANAEIAREESLVRLNAAIAKNGGSLSTATEAGRENAKAVLDLIAKSQKLAQTKFDEEVANGNAAGAQAAANQAYQDSIAPLKGMITQGIIAEEEVRDLIDTFDEVPPLKETEITTPGLDQAKTGVKDYGDNYLAKIPPEKSTTITLVTATALAQADRMLAALAAKAVTVNATVNFRYTSGRIPIKFPDGTVEYVNIGQFGAAEGGPVKGPGGPKDDLIPMMLSNGEFVLSAKAVENLGGMLAVTKLHNTAKMTDLTKGTNPSAFAGDIAALTNANRASIGLASGGGYNVNIGQIVAPTPEIAARRVISETRAAAYRMGVGV